MAGRLPWRDAHETDKYRASARTTGSVEQYAPIEVLFAFASLTQKGLPDAAIAHQSGANIGAAWRARWLKAGTLAYVEIACSVHGSDQAPSVDNYVQVRSW